MKKGGRSSQCKLQAGTQAVYSQVSLTPMFPCVSSPLTWWDRMTTAGERSGRAGASPPWLSITSGQVTTTVAAVLLLWRLWSMTSESPGAWLGARVVTLSGVTITNGTDSGTHGWLALLPPAAGSSARGSLTLHSEGAGLEQPASEDAGCGSLQG